MAGEAKIFPQEVRPRFAGFLAAGSVISFCLRFFSCCIFRLLCWRRAPEIREHRNNRQTAGGIGAVCAGGGSAGGV